MRLYYEPNEGIWIAMIKVETKYRCHMSCRVDEASSWQGCHHCYDGNGRVVVVTLTEDNVTST